MSEQGHLSDLGYEGQFGLERRGYNRMQVDEAVAQLRLDLLAQEERRRELEHRLSQTVEESERLKAEVAEARSTDKPAHEQISERISQILKLADDEAQSQRSKADDDIAKLRADAKADTDKLRADAKAETDKNRAEAQEQAERMLSAAQEQADSTLASAKEEAENARKSAATEAQQVVADASRQAETAVATAKSQAKQQLDEATARATAIHDGAERRLNLLMSRHTEAVRRLTEIRDVVTTLVAGEVDRGSLEDEVARIVAGANGSNGEAQAGARPAGNGRPGAEGRHAGASGQAALSTAQRPGGPGTGGPGTGGPGTGGPANGGPGTGGPANGGPANGGAQTGAQAAQPGGPAAGQPNGGSQPAGAPATQAPGNGRHPEGRPSGPDAAGPEGDDTADRIKIIGD